MSVDSIALGFHKLVVAGEASNGESKVLLDGISGYVKKGCMTVVMGASGSGKSLLLQSLSGRIQELNIAGDITMRGRRVNPKDITNPVAYVPQESFLCGELTAREVMTDTAMLKRNESREALDEAVDELLQKLGLTQVADGIIGTLIFRGLSGGQKKRVEIGAELIASPSILLLDEPSSGLDSSIAFEVLNSIRELVKESDGKLSVIASLHQPNSRILQLFDDILLLEHGKSIYFGGVSEVTSYFGELGYHCPKNVTPTDYFLQISDSNFAFSTEFNFAQAYRGSASAVQVNSLLDELRATPTDNQDEASLQEQQRVPVWTQFKVLLRREYILAKRDPTLYYLQMAMLLMFAFLIGVVFWDLPKEVDGTSNTIIIAGLIWFTMMFGWVHAFKVYYLSGFNKRITHELSNNAYGPLTIAAAETVSTLTLTVIFLPIVPILYYMQGFPTPGFPYLLLLGWMTSATFEALVGLITKFSRNPTVSMVFSQMALVTLMIFSGGLFIPWKDVPKYWLWLQEATGFTQSTRSAIMQVMRFLTFGCSLNIAGQCIDPASGAEYKCEEGSKNEAGTRCDVNGREILSVTHGIGTEDDFWYYFAYLCVIFLVLKSLVVLLTVYPWPRMSYKLKVLLMHRFRSGMSSSDIVIDVSASNVSKAKELDVEKGSYESVEGDQVADIRSIRAASAQFGDLSSHTHLSWKNVTVTLRKNGAKLVTNASGYVQSGKVLALMGPSGAGKTTLLNALARRAPFAEIEGEVNFAGRVMTSRDLTYIPQFDAINPTLTVFEHLRLVGELTSANEEEMFARAEKLLEVLGLLEKRDVQVKDLSGGEVKRVSVGVGMISNPHVLFLDEPTTGLDSTAAYSIASYLVSVARSTNVAIIMTIHQPSALVFDLFDDLLLLEAGHVVYGGPVAQARKYFSSIGFGNDRNINPADYYLELMLRPPSDGAQWRDKFQSSEFSKQYYDNVNQASVSTSIKEYPQLPSFSSRFWTMLKYFMKYLIKEPGFFIHRAYALVFLGIFAGTIYLDLKPRGDQIGNYMGAMFFGIMCVMLTAVAPTALYARDRVEAVDRVANGFYSPGLYVLTQFIASSIYNWFVAFLFVCIFHWLTNINPNHEAFVYDIFSSWAHLLLMEAGLMTIIEGLKNDFLSTSAAMNLIGTNMIFSGFFRPVSEMPKAINWLPYAVPMKWSFSGLAWSTFSSQDFLIDGNPDDKLSGEDLLRSSFRLKNINAWAMFGVLLGYVFFFRLNQYFMFAMQTGKLPVLGLFANRPAQRVQRGKDKESSVSSDLSHSSSTRVVAPMEIADREGRPHTQEI